MIFVCSPLAETVNNTATHTQKKICAASMRVWNRQNAYYESEDKKLIYRVNFAGRLRGPRGAFPKSGPFDAGDQRNRVGRLL